MRAGDCGELIATYFVKQLQLDFCFFRGFLEPLQGHLVLREIYALILAEFLNDPVDDPLIDVVSAQVSVSVCRLHLNDALANFENRDVEGSAPEIKHRNRFVLFLIQPVSERRRSRLIYYAHYFEASDLPPDVNQSAAPTRSSSDHRTLAALEREAILSTLAAERGSRARTAERLEIGQATLFRKLKQYQSEGHLVAPAA